MPLKIEHESDGLSTWSKFGVRTYQHYPILCRSVYLATVMYSTVFEMQRFKLKKNNDNKTNWRNGLFAISPMLMVQFKPKFR